MRWISGAARGALLAAAVAYALALTGCGPTSVLQPRGPAAARIADLGG